MSEPTKEGDVVSLLKSRQEIYADFKTEPKGDESSKKDDTQSPEAENAEGKSAEPVVKGQEDTKGEPKPDVKPPLEQKKTEQETLVSKKALDAERALRREKALEARKYKEAAEVATKKSSELEMRLAEYQRQSPDFDAKEARIKELEAENAAHKAAKVREEEDRRIEQMRAAYHAAVKSTDEGLVKDGFPGFSLHTEAIREELLARVRSGEVEESVADTMEYAANVYKEVIFPKVKAVLIQEKDEQRAALLKKKEEDKLAAQGATSSGSQPAPKEEKTLDAASRYEVYLKQREHTRPK